MLLYWHYCAQYYPKIECKGIENFLIYANFYDVFFLLEQINDLYLLI
jgi:hypothetical protein